MSIYKKPNSRFWWYAVRNGKSYLRGSTGTENEDVARAIEQTVRSAQKRTTPADRLHKVIDALVGHSTPQAVTGLLLAGIWGEYERHVRTLGKKLADSTLKQRRQRCRNFADWAKSDRPACETAEQVDRACASAYGVHLAKLGTKGKTRANIINDLGAVWAGLSRIRDGVTTNPWHLVVPETNDSTHGKAFTLDEEISVIKAADAVGHGWGLACRIARHTGLRYGDVSRLTWDRVDLVKREIALAPSKTARHGIAVRIPLTGVLYDALAAARRADPFGASLFPEVYDVFECRPQIPFCDVLSAAGVDADAHTFHSWRHTFRTRLSEAGVADEIAKRLGGWRKDETAERYDHATRMTELQAAVDAGALQSVVTAS